MKLKRFLAFTFAVVLFLSVLGCVKDPGNKHGDTETSMPSDNPYADAPVWFCPYTCSMQTDSPAKVINIATGEVLVACSDPLCNHSASSETCFFNFVHDRTRVRGAAYVDGHIFFAAERTSEDGAYMKLYDYDMISSRIDEVYTFDYIGSTLQLYGCGHMLFFTAITEADVNEEGVIADTAIIGLFAYDSQKKTLTLLDGNAMYALYPTDIAFYENYYVFAAGYNQDEDRIIYCKRSYDGSDEELIEALPDGTPFELFGYQLKSSGFFASTEANGGIYLPDENRCLAWPIDSATTKPVVYNDSFYFTTRSSEITELGRDPETGTQALGYAYDNEIYVVNKDGTYKHYSIDSEYHFIIESVYDNIVIGRIVYRIRDNGDCIRERDGGPDIIRIDLETGETTLYDTSMRSGFVSKTIITNVTLNEN